MNQNQKDQQASTSRSDQQNQAVKNEASKTGTPSGPSTMVEDAQAGKEKEHQEDKHQHDSKTPVGGQKSQEQKSEGGKSDRISPTDKNNQTPKAESNSTSKAL